MNDRAELRMIVKSSIGTKFIKKWSVSCPSSRLSSLSNPLPPPYRSDLACDMALDAVQTVAVQSGDRKEIDIKRYAKVEKV